MSSSFSSTGSFRTARLSVNAVEEEVEGFPDADVTAALNAPAEVGGVVARARVVHINIAEHGGSD